MIGKTNGEAVALRYILNQILSHAQGRIYFLANSKRYGYQFKQLIHDYKRIAELSSTLIDLTYTTDSAKITDSTVIECSISDHALLYDIRRAKISKSPIETIRF